MSRTRASHFLRTMLSSWWRACCLRELPPGSAAENAEGGVHGVWFADSAADLAMVMNEESDSEEDDLVVIDRHGRPISREAAREEYLCMEARGSRLPPYFRSRLLEFTVFLGIEDE
ncbi:unnamed protein product [Prorocentrum cordatum]|uniref:Uncharacterized protein n=1 Tax=Prorocentrum cordatum TaxID=2364126 RepID=A0ABN9TMI9_9DINO|nr:unnamed protein product [Polarella glacialis]